MTTVYLIRHAYAEGNLNKTFQGSVDGKLTELGYRQLDRLAERCRDLGIDAVYSSPLSRAFETAYAVDRHYGHGVIINKKLTEIDGGAWEGCSWGQLKIKYPDVYQKWTDCDPEFRAPEGEKLGDVYVRMRDVILRIVDKNRNGTVSIISHGCATKCFMAWAKGFTAEQLADVPIPDNTALNCIQFDDALNPKVILENDISHLDESLRTYAHSLFSGSV